MERSLADIRKEKGYTQAEIASLLGISVATYCLYEKGRSIPSEIVDKISDILKIKRCKNDIFLASSFTVRKSEGGGEDA